MIIYGVWARIASYVSPKRCKFSPKCGKSGAVSLILETSFLLGLILQVPLWVARPYVYLANALIYAACLSRECPARVERGILEMLSFLLLLAGIVHRFFRDGHVMRVAFFKSSRCDAYEARIRAQFFEVACSKVAHARA